jgi:hypothetical protein
LGRLQQLGFNTISLESLPTSAQLAEAEQLGLALFCPPPDPQTIQTAGIDEALSPVLAWNLGTQLSSEDLEPLERWERLVARHDPREARPTVLAPQLRTLEASRIADITLVGRAVLGTELTMREHATWLSQRKRLTRPGTPLWTTLETEPSSAQHLQLAALTSAATARRATSYQQLTALTSAALGIKPQGFLFESYTSLTSEDRVTQQRARALELTNLRLQLMEPWLVAGKELLAARCSQPELSALVLQAERSHLLVPVWWSQPLKSAGPPQSAVPLSFVVPGVAESSDAFLLSLGGLERVRRRRVTGGIRVSLDALPSDSLLLFSDDPRAIAQVTRYLRSIAPRAARLRRDLASDRLEAIAGTYAQLRTEITLAAPLTAQLDNAQRALARCDQALSGKQFDVAYLQADRLESALDQFEQTLEAELGQSAPALEVMPLPERLALQRTFARAPLTANLLAGGGFESLSGLLENGWRHKQLPLEGITSAVRLSPEAPHSGSYCLELEARPVDPLAPATVVPTSPVWVASAPLQLAAGDLVEITGVARLPEPLVGSVDGLQIFDSLGGTEMALRIQVAPSWQPFRLVRAVIAPAELSVTIALSGLGKAQIDDLAIRKVTR